MHRVDCAGGSPALTDRPRHRNQQARRCAHSEHCVPLYSITFRLIPAAQPCFAFHVSHSSTPATPVKAPEPATGYPSAARMGRRDKRHITRLLHLNYLAPDLKLATPEPPHRCCPVVEGFQKGKGEAHRVEFLFGQAAYRVFNLYGIQRNLCAISAFCCSTREIRCKRSFRLRCQHPPEFLSSSLRTAKRVKLLVHSAKCNAAA